MAVPIICALGLFFTKQSVVFIKDIFFYREMGWDLCRDSGNRLYLFAELRQSGLFRKFPTGFLRLLIGVQHLAVAFILFYGVFYWLTALVLAN